MLTKQAVFTLFILPLLFTCAATAADLDQAQPTVDFNYSNGQVGHHVTGLSAEDAGDIQLNEDPLPAPTLQSSNDQEAELQASKNLPEELNGREKQKGRQ